MTASPSREVLVSKLIPAPHGPSYSHAVRAGGFVFCSGQMGERPDGTLEPDAGSQARVALENLDRVLSEFGTSLDAAVKLTVFLVDWDRDYTAVSRELDRRLSTAKPVRSTVEIRRLAMGGLVEIDAVVIAS
jgi:2-iminobutanoate/2-iminopropanoate deaminase